MLHFIFVIILLEKINHVCTDTDQSIKNENILTNISLEVEPRILQGRPADLGEYPWMVYLYFQDPKGRSTCGGAIISHRHVLTAGHCCTGAILDTIRVRVSELDLEMNPDCVWEIFHLQLFGFGCDSYIKEYKVENYTEFTTFNLNTFPSGDICIIRVSEDIVFGKYVQPINLPFGNGVNFQTWLFHDAVMTTIGWGYINGGMKTEKSILMETTIKVVEETECRIKWRRHYPLVANNVGFEHICAGSSGGSTPCGGDSGGPLMYVHEGKTYLIGIVSTATFCVPFNPIDVPHIFMRVDFYKDWIERNM